MATRGLGSAGQAAGQVAGRVDRQAGPGQGVEAAQAGRVIRLALVPEEVCPDDGRELGFWGNDAGAATRAARALARVQSLLGPEAALTAVLAGGRDYSEQVLFVPWGEPRCVRGPASALPAVAPLRPAVMPGPGPAVMPGPGQAPERGWAPMLGRAAEAGPSTSSPSPTSRPSPTSSPSPSRSPSPERKTQSRVKVKAKAKDGLLLLGRGGSPGWRRRSCTARR